MQILVNDSLSERNRPTWNDSQVIDELKFCGKISIFVNREVVEHALKDTIDNYIQKDIKKLQLMRNHAIVIIFLLFY